ncbi:MAG: hypothetical protein HC927_08285 [Deltaproteobacteria bacterium]|nr:hypothetical protein [Deltaproteobacteria bacterium]
MVAEAVEHQSIIHVVWSEAAPDSQMIIDYTIDRGESDLLLTVAVLVDMPVEKVITGFMPFGQFAAPFIGPIIRRLMQRTLRRHLNAIASAPGDKPL